MKTVLLINNEFKVHTIPDNKALIKAREKLRSILENKSNSDSEFYNQLIEINTIKGELKKEYVLKMMIDQAII